MGFFKTIVNDLLGAKREYAVKGLGIFTCKVCEWWKEERYIWSGTVRLPSYPEETVILVEGDALAPSPQQLAELRMLLDNWDAVILRLESMLSRESRLAHKEEIYASWQKTFYLDSITPVAEDNGGWEIAFERTDDKKDYFFFIWKNNTIYDLTLGVGA